MKWKEISDADLNGALVAVLYGQDPVAARNLIEYFYERLEAGRPLNERVLFEYLHHAFGKIIGKNWSVDTAFGLQHKRGPYPREETLARDIAATACMSN